MPRVDFDQLPDDARLWIFPAERALNEAEQDQLLTEVDRFIGQWGAHDVGLTAGRELRYDRFLFVAVDQRTAGPSGCSIDALFRQTVALEQEIGIELVNHAPVVFRQGSAIERVPRDQFAELAAAGNVDFETTVFDNTLTRLGDLRGGPVGDTAGQLVARARLLLVGSTVKPRSAGQPSPRRCCASRQVTGHAPYLRPVDDR